MLNKFFVVGFVLSLLVFVGLNIYSYQTAEPPCCDFSATFGFPLPLGTIGGFVGVTSFYLPGCFANIGIALGTSVFSGFIFVRVLPRLLDRVVEVGLKMIQWHKLTRS